MSETRRERQTDALKTLCYELGNISDVLTEISEDTSLTGSSGNTARTDAKALANGL